MEKNYKVLKAGESLYALRPKSQSQNIDKAFQKSGQALLWGLLTLPNIQPISGFDDADTSKTVPGKMHPEYRYPNHDEFRLVKIEIKEDTKFLVSRVTDDDIGIAISMGETLTIAEVDVGESPIARVSLTEIEDDRDAIQKVIELYSAADASGYEKIDTRMIRTGVIRAIGYIMEPVVSVGIDWEQVWVQFVKARMKGFSLEQTLAHFQKILTGPEAHFFIAAMSKPGFEDCADSIKGLYNSTGNSCFMDSTLMAMFAFKDSPFYENLLSKPFNGDPTGDLVCREDLEADTNLRRQIQDVLKEDVQKLLTGRNQNCSFLRKLLGRDCRKFDYEQDLSVGYQDPFELYTRLMSVLAYKPITYTEINYRADDQNDTNLDVTDRSNDHISLPTLYASNETMTSISWPESWNTGTYEYIQDLTERPYRKTEIAIERADCIVVNVSRILMGRPGGNLPEDLSTLFDADSTSESSSESVSRDSPKFDSNRDQTAVDGRFIRVETEFDIGGTIYTLKSVVYSPTNGHYATLLRCGENWYTYDDLNVNTYISENIIDTRRAMYLISTRGVILFYYKGGARRERYVEPLPTIPSGTEFANPLLALMSASEPVKAVMPVVRELRISTFNVSYYTMNNTVAGTESDHVAMCQATYPLMDEDENYIDGYDGWFSQEKNISRCTLNAAGFLSKFDIMALQEVDENMQEEFQNTINYLAIEGHKIDVSNGLASPDEFPNHNYLTANKGLVVAYNETLTGPGILVTNPDTPFPIFSDLHTEQDIRVFMLVYFPRLKLLFGNIHSPRGIDYEKQLDLLFTYVEANMNLANTRYQERTGDKMIYDRIILAGDFNDSMGQLTDVEINAFGKVMSLPPGPDGGVVKSCCTDTGHQYPGDYIFDSEKSHKYYGLPRGYVRGQPLMSDHDPVVLITNFII